MLFRSKRFWILVSIFLYSSTVRAQLSLRSPEPRITTRFNCCTFLLLRGSVQCRPEPLEDRTLDVEEGDDGMKLVLR